jgi:hypothetical protein
MQKLWLTHESACSSLTPATFDGFDQCAAIEAGVVTPALASASAAITAPSRATTALSSDPLEASPSSLVVRAQPSWRQSYTRDINPAIASVVGSHQAGQPMISVGQQCAISFAPCSIAL